MIIDITEHDKLSKVMAEMIKDGFHFVAFPAVEISDISNTTCFKTAWEATEYCFELSTDVDFYKSLPIQSVLSNLETIRYMQIDTSVHEAIEIDNLAERYRDSIQFLNTNLNDITMNEKNFEYLKDQVMYTGFGESMEGELRQNMEKLEPSFSLKHDAFYGNDKVSAELNFKKSDQTDLYFFNSYKVQLQKEGQDQKLEQTIYINRGNNITLKEAYNLMEGRAVNKDLTNKEGEVYNAWIQMDFKQADAHGNFKLNHYHQNYGYDLVAAFAKSSVKELNDPKIAQDTGAIDSLKKGNLQSVIIEKNGTSTKYYIEANPQFKSINVYDANKRRLDSRQTKSEKQDQTESNSVKKDDRKERQSQSAVDGESVEGVAKKKRGQSKSL